jgi:hypothetical protein
LFASRFIYQRVTYCITLRHWKATNNRIVSESSFEPESPRIKSIHPWSNEQLEMLGATQTNKKFAAVYGTTVFTTNRCVLSGARKIPVFTPYFFMIYFSGARKLNSASLHSSPLDTFLYFPNSPKWSFIRFSDKSNLSDMRYLSLPISSSFIKSP